MTDPLDAAAKYSEDELKKINRNGPKLNVTKHALYTIENPESKKTCIVNGTQVEHYTDLGWKAVPYVAPAPETVEEVKDETPADEDKGDEDTGNEGDEDEEVAITKDDIKAMDQEQLRALCADANIVVVFDGLKLKAARNAVIEKLGLE